MIKSVTGSTFKKKTYMLFCVFYCADPQFALRDHQSPGSNCCASISPAAGKRYRNGRQPHTGGRRYVTMAYNPSLRYCTVETAAQILSRTNETAGQSALRPAPHSSARLYMCVFISGGTVYQPVTVVTPQGQVVTQALSPGTIRVQNNQVVQPCECDAD